MPPGRARSRRATGGRKLARARDQLSDEATLVSYLANDGGYVQAITGAIRGPGIQPISFKALTQAMLEEAGGVEEKARLDPNRPMPEPQFHLASGGGQKGWG